MYTIFLIGNIASGKSFAAHYLSERGAYCLDLDVMAKRLYVPGSPITHELAQEFGWNILDGSGAVRTRELALRAFATPERTAALNAIVHPPLFALVADIIAPYHCCSVTSPVHELICVEVSVAAQARSMFGLADEVIAVSAPCAIRRVRACERGMDEDDFDARSALQPSEEELCSWAHTIWDNATGDSHLERTIDLWLAQHDLLQREPGGAR